MIIFISGHPEESDGRDGMAQRVSYIDKLCEIKQRLYIKISFFRNLKKQERRHNISSVIEVNFFIHFWMIYKLLKCGEIIYVHSVYNALRILPFYFFYDNIATDIHGVVPEEKKYEKKWARAILFGMAEYIVSRKSMILIYVTESMRNHFMLKHGRDFESDITMPILPNFKDSKEPFQDKTVLCDRNPNAVIYAGGTQAWQNIDLMINAVLIQTSYQYTFLTPDKDVLKRKLYNCNNNNFKLDSAMPSEVFMHYLNNSFGFLLRDDHLVNRVACPTKLVEYMMFGVIPLVLSPNIGDFQGYGYKFIEYSEFLNGINVSSIEIRDMRIRNKKIAMDILNAGRASEIKIKNIFNII